MIRFQVPWLIVTSGVLISLCTAIPTPQDHLNVQIPPNGDTKFKLNSTKDERRPVYKQGQRENPDGVKELFGFPAANSAIESRQNARNRTPVYVPNQCLENEILYPGDQQSDWVCDCKPTFVYHPPTRKCYEMYTKGYCNNGTMIYMAPEAKRPECVPNDCSDEKQQPSVRYQGECVLLNEYHQLCNHGFVQLLVGIDEETHQLKCINISDVKLDEKNTDKAKQPIGNQPS